MCQMNSVSIELPPVDERFQPLFVICKKPDDGGPVEFLTSPCDEDEINEYLMRYDDEFPGEKTFPSESWPIVLPVDTDSIRLIGESPRPATPEVADDEIALPLALHVVVTHGKNGPEIHMVDTKPSLCHRALGYLNTEIREGYATMHKITTHVVVPRPVVAEPQTEEVEAAECA